ASDLALPLLARAVRRARGVWFVPEPQNLEPRDLTRVLRRLSLVVVEVRGDRNHGLLHGLAEECLRVRPDLAENHRADLLRRVGLPVDCNLEVRAHLALDLHD